MRMRMKTSRLRRTGAGNAPGKGRKSEQKREPSTGSIYGPDPGDASVEYYYLKVQEQIRLGIIDLRTYPNEGPGRKNGSWPER